MSRVGISIGVRLKLNSIEPLFLGVPSKIGEHTAALVEDVVQGDDDFGDREIEHGSSMVGVGGSVGFCNSWARVVNLTRLETLASIYCGKATAPRFSFPPREPRGYGEGARSGEFSRADSGSNVAAQRSGLVPWGLARAPSEAKPTTPDIERRTFGWLSCGATQQRSPPASTPAAPRPLGSRCRRGTRVDST